MPTQTEQLLRDQWRVLRTWLDTERVLSRSEEPSGIGAWTIGDLVTHLGYGLHMLAEVGATDADPVRLASYVAGYAPARDRIAADTVDVAASLGGRVLTGIDALATEAWGALEAGLPEVVLGRRGPLRREDFVTTRLIELVAHGDDLHRALGPDHRSPLLPAAVDRVADALAVSYAEVAGRATPWRGLDLVRVATGRVPVDDPAMPLLS